MLSKAGFVKRERSSGHWEGGADTSLSRAASIEQRGGAADGHCCITFRIHMTKCDNSRLVFHQVTWLVGKWRVLVILPVHAGRRKRSVGGIKEKSHLARNYQSCNST